MTDLEKHVNQPGRAKLVKQVRAKINELGIEYIFFNSYLSQVELLEKEFRLITGKEHVKKVFN